MQYPIVQRPDSRGGFQGTGDADAEIKFCPVATWLGSSSSFSDPVNPGIPVISMACRDDEVVKTLQKQCVSGNWSLDQLSACPGHLFVDLFTMLSQWSEGWSEYGFSLGVVRTRYIFISDIEADRANKS
jgi:hypothetical protein